MRGTPRPCSVVQDLAGAHREFLGVSVVARDLKEARTDPDYSLEAILARAAPRMNAPSNGSGAR